MRFHDDSATPDTSAVDETREVPQVVIPPTPTPTPAPILPTPVPSDPAASTHRVPPPISAPPQPADPPPTVTSPPSEASDPVPTPTLPDPTPPAPVTDTESKTREVIVPASVLAPVNHDSTHEKPLERLESEEDEDADTALLRPPSGNDPA